MHLVPLGAWLVLQAPAEQTPCQHRFDPPEQALQAPPALPHLDTALPTRQLTPSQQPVQQAPLRHTPPVHLVPSLSPELEHLPLEQVPDEHGFLEVEQLAQAPPLAPQAAAAVPALHTVPAQHPLQLLLGHLPPQPSAAPAHLPAQLGTHLHCPESQVWLALQEPQVPPQPSEPQLLPAQSGAQPEQVPALQVLPDFSVQSTQVAPDMPHRVSDAPAKHDVLSLLQQPTQAAGSQTHVPPSPHLVLVGQPLQPPPSAAPGDSGAGVVSRGEASARVPASGLTLPSAQPHNSSAATSSMIRRDITLL